MGATSLPSFIQISSTHSIFTEKLSTPQKKFQIRISTRHTNSLSWTFPSLPSCKALQNSVPLAASLAILLWSTPGRYYQYHVLLFMQLTFIMLCHYVVLCWLKFHSLYMNINMLITNSKFEHFHILQQMLDSCQEFLVQRLFLVLSYHRLTFSKISMVPS